MTDNIDLKDLLKQEYCRIDDSDYNYLAIGDIQTQVIVSRRSSERLKGLITAAIKTESLGLSSVDYVYKKFSKSWDMDIPISEKEIVVSKILNLVKNTVNEYIELIQNELNSINTIGLIVAKSAMLRLINTFKSIIILISKDLFIESMALSRIILEQCAWCYCICSKNEYTDILKINPLDCLKSFKNFYCNAGKVNGFLSKRVHLDVGLVGNYLSINQNEHIITFNPTKDKLDSLYSILQQTDMYCCTIEYTFSQFIDNFKFIDCETTDYRIKDNREFILIANELLDKIYELYDRK